MASRKDRFGKIEVVTINAAPWVQDAKVVGIVSRFHITIALIGVIACAGLATLGLVLAFLHGDSNAESSIDFLGLIRVKTEYIGIGLTALGVGGAIFTIRAVLKSFRDTLGG